MRDNVVDHSNAIYGANLNLRYIAFIAFLAKKLKKINEYAPDN